MSITNEAGTLSASTTAADLELTNSYKRGYVHNSGSVDAIIYLNETDADVAAKEWHIKAGVVYPIEVTEGSITGFRYKTASSTTTLLYNFLF